jgi:hypothetical protein
MKSAGSDEFRGSAGEMGARMASTVGGLAPFGRWFACYAKTMRAWLAAIWLCGCNHAVPAIDDGGTCGGEPAGADFVFHIVKHGTTTRRLTLGCGQWLPLSILTSDGARGLSVGDGQADPCQVSCEFLYANPGYSGVCSDCGPGTGVLLPPGAAIDLHWDRRSYQAITPDPACTPLSIHECWRARPLPAAPLQAQLLLCDDGQTPNPAGSGGSCGQPLTPLSFSFDPAANQVTIDVP